MLTNILLYIITGSIAGILSGALGIGGGVVVVPALLMIFQHNGIISGDLSMHMATGTSLAILMLTSQASLRAHRQLDDILWPVYHRLFAGLILGTLSGALLADSIPSSWLEWCFGIFLLLVAMKIGFDRKVSRGRQFPPQLINHIASFLIGLLSGMLGIGGGLLIVPYLTYCGVNIRKIVAVSVSCTMTVAIIGTLAFIISGYNRPGLPSWSTGYVYWPAVLCIGVPGSLTAPIGARLAYVIPLTYLRAMFILLLLVTAYGMLT
ncbi:sulfite exporter TauE/SafE family protein [Legionella sp. CNM-4043-24]|uniref:sulfite exporter TauE/SafE family protein n=1 Tax=Legionella sp. CNM-4043-24 TaxID=3421646 RepID=UPI00403AA1E8